MERFRGGLVFKAHGLLFHSTLGSRVIKRGRDRDGEREGAPGGPRLGFSAAKTYNFEVSPHRSVLFSIEEQLLRRNVERFRGGIVWKAHRLLYHSTLGTRVIKKNKKTEHGHS